jgi:hypothetical protein
LLFVLDDPISSNHSKGGQFARAHLRSDLVVGGRTVAAAGTPAQIKIVDASPSDIADTYGFVDIFFEPLVLPDGRSLPLRTPIARLTPNVSTGHESTVGAEDTIGDIFVPYYSIWQIVRKGKNFVLGAGSIVSARTEATLTAQPNGAIAIVTPRPLTASNEAPISSYTAMPLATPFGPNGATPRPHSRPTPPPTSTPSPSPAPTSTTSPHA